MKRRQNTKPRRTGIAIVEGAIVLTVMLLLVFAGLDLALAVLRYNSLAAAACRGARCAATHGATALQLGSVGPSTMAFAGDSSNAIATAMRGSLPTMAAADVQATVEWPDGGNAVDDRVRVTLIYQHQSVVPAFLGIGTLNLRAESVMTIAH